MPSSTFTLDFHSSIRSGARRQRIVEALRNNRLDPSLLYATPQQAALWREVFLRHSPIHTNPEFTRIYREAFCQISEQVAGKKISVVGLGAGTGQKELALYHALKNSQREILFSAIDVSADLVLEAVEKLTTAGANHERSLVVDLGEADFLAEWLGQRTQEFPRLFTFFGLFPNLLPTTALRLFRAILRPGDIVLASAHLAPVISENPEEIPAAMQTIFPQYNNEETKSWLTVALPHLGLQNRVYASEMVVGEVEKIPAVLGLARWKSKEPFEFEGQPFNPSAEPFRLFYSLRYTPARLEKMLRAEGFQVEQLGLTACREEAIWAIRR
jgi:Histidine-specific methyltransferase, SAM-dependent